MITEVKGIIVNYEAKMKTVNAITLLRLKWYQKEFRLAQNQSGKCDYNLKPGCYMQRNQPLTAVRITTSIGYKIIKILKYHVFHRWCALCINKYNKQHCTMNQD